MRRCRTLVCVVLSQIAAERGYETDYGCKSHVSEPDGVIGQIEANDLMGVTFADLALARSGQWLRKSLIHNMSGCRSIVSFVLYQIAAERGYEQDYDCKNQVSESDGVFGQIEANDFVGVCYMCGSRTGQIRPMASNEFDICADVAASFLLF